MARFKVSYTPARGKGDLPTATPSSHRISSPGISRQRDRLSSVRSSFGRPAPKGDPHCDRRDCSPECRKRGITRKIWLSENCTLQRSGPEIREMGGCRLLAASLIEALSAGLTAFSWRIGRRILRKVLGNQRATYRKRIVATLWRQLMSESVRGFSRPSNVRLAKACTS